MVHAADELTTRFRSPDLAAAFRARYAEALARWPDDTGGVDVPGPFGTTHVQVCGPPDAPPLVLLHGGGCTSASWFASAGALSRAHRVHAVDQLGGAGLSVPSGRPIRRPADFMAWLDGLLGGLGLESAAFCGHSYGAWLALSYALHAPGRVRRLALLDPTGCFGGLAPGYRLRAVPLLARPTQARARAVLTWETARAEPPADELLMSLASLGGGEFRGSRLVLPRRPAAAALRATKVPMLVVLAERSRAHDIRRIGATARRLVPGAETAVLPGAAHHTLPATAAGPLNELLTGFLLDTEPGAARLYN
jgi:pimeloyl-ACP methyl ester carboxylesterase